MTSGIKTINIKIGGMTCENCQRRIAERLREKAGVHSAAVSYKNGSAAITYDEAVVSRDEIAAAIADLGYTVNRRGSLRSAGILIIIAALYVLLERFGLLNMLAPSGLADEAMGYGAIFVLGLFTSVHCAAMCGGLNLSQCVQRDGGANSARSAFRPAILYNLGRVASYTAIGFIVGAIGTAVTFSAAAQGVLKLIAGVFMLVMGVNMLGIFPWLNRLAPRLPKIFARAATGKKAKRAPLAVGLLNGLMPCGPLQAMQIYALSTGSPLLGALSMLLFGLGTAPLMFGLGAFVSALGGKFTAKVMTIGAVLVAVMGLSMLTQGFSLAGAPSRAASAAVPSEAPEIVDGVQTVNSTLSARRYPNITVSAGTPVKWVIDAPENQITGCNNRMLIGEYGIEHTFVPGENIIEFTPSETGRFRYSCWMGMIRATITVV